MSLQNYINSAQACEPIPVSEEFILSLGFHKTGDEEKYTIYKITINHQDIEMPFTLMYIKGRQYFVIMNDVFHNLEGCSFSTNTGTCLTSSGLEHFIKSYITYWVFSLSNTISNVTAIN